jgi:hypothetical protein
MALATRDDRSFVPAYMGSSRQFVLAEKPTDLHERLIVQQGVYLCPGDVRASFVRNLAAMRGWENAANVVKLRLSLDRSELQLLKRRLDRMNITSAELFPGLDGIVRSLKESLERDHALWRAGTRRKSRRRR